MKISVLAILTAGAALILSGCSQQSTQSADKDVSNGMQTVSSDAKKIGDQAGPTLKKMGDEAAPTINKIDSKAQPALTEAGLGLRVTTALRANANLPDTIRVDASVDGVRLRGVVQTSHQKALAGKIAQSTLPPGKSVRNQLTVKS